MATAVATPVDAKARSLELALARGETMCSWAAQPIGMTLDGDEPRLINAAWRIASASSDAKYVVTYQAVEDRVQCECAAAQHGRPCWHSGLGLMLGHYLARLYSLAGHAEAQSQYQRDLAHEGDAYALGY